MYEIVSSLLKYIFVTIIYLFIFAIIRMIYFDIRSMNTHMSSSNKKTPYLKLISSPADLHLDMKAAECYVIVDNMTVGRDPSNNIEIDDPFLSGSHAMFMKQDGGFLLKDLESTNGTFVNGERLADEAFMLKDGDKIQMGQLEFLYVSGMEVK